jgi:hypothetical protein
MKSHISFLLSNNLLNYEFLQVSQIMQLAPIEVYYSRVIENIFITTTWGQRQFFVQLDRQINTLDHLLRGRM